MNYWSFSCYHQFKLNVRALFLVPPYSSELLQGYLSFVKMHQKLTILALEFCRTSAGQPVTQVFFFWLIACEFWRIIFPLSWTSFMNPPYYLFQTRYFHSIFYQFSLISRTSLLLGRNSQYHELIFYVVRQFCNAIIFFSKVYKLVS